MSAFVLSGHHIDLLVSAAIDHGIAFKLDSSGPLETASEANAQALGTMLWAENIRSVVYRYCLLQTEEENDYLRTLSAYRFKRYEQIRAAAAASALACYDYQSCECPDYEDGPAALFIEQLRNAVGDRPRGYDAEPWGYNTEAQVQTAREVV